MTEKKKVWAIESGFGMTLVLTAASAFSWVGCSGTSNGADDVDSGAKPVDVRPGIPTTDSGTSIEAGPQPCPDTPFDCAATAGDGGTDANSTGQDPDPAATVPVSLRCTGLYACWSTKSVATTHRAYKPAFTLYSDGAEKTRWLVLPPNHQIDTGQPKGDPREKGGSPDEWIFPVGTMVYKEFKLAGKRVETRRIWKASESAWVYSVWRWSENESSATLMNTGALLPNAARPGHIYEIPSTTLCANCHDGHRDKLLSLDAWSLAAPGASGITLTTLAAEGRLSHWPHPTTFAVPQDGTGMLDKAVGFYYSNCGFCHRPGRPGGASGLELYLPASAALPAFGGGLGNGGAGLPASRTPVYLTAVGVPHVNSVGGMFPPDFARITPGNAAKSVLPLRDSLRGTDGGITMGQMPPIVVRTADTMSVEATRAWINALPEKNP